MAAAQPFVVYSTCSEVAVPYDDWPALYASLQALKAHVQEYPGCQRFDVFTASAPHRRASQWKPASEDVEAEEVEADMTDLRAEPGSGVRVHCYTTWETLAQLEAFVERGYTFERLLADLGGDIQLERSLVMEKVF